MEGFITKEDIFTLAPVGLKRLYLSKLPDGITKRSVETSIIYLALDYVLLGSSAFTAGPMFTLCQIFTGRILGSVLGLLLFANVYGVVMSSLFTVGHDCVHEVFSTSGYSNRFYGIASLTPLLIPFSSFQVEHRKYHQRINRGKCCDPFEFLLF